LFCSFETFFVLVRLLVLVTEKFEDEDENDDEEGY